MEEFSDRDRKLAASAVMANLMGAAFGTAAVQVSGLVGAQAIALPVEQLSKLAVGAAEELSKAWDSRLKEVN